MKKESALRIKFKAFKEKCGAFKTKVGAKFRKFTYAISYKMHVLFGKIFPKKNGKKKTMSTFKKATYVFIGVMLAYDLVQWIVFYWGVNIRSLLLSIQDYDVTTMSFSFLPISKLFSNYERFFQMVSGGSELLFASFWRSLLLFAISYAVFPISVIFSYLMFKKVPGAELFKSILFLRSGVSALVLTVIFKLFMDNALPQFLGLFGVTNVPNFLGDPKYQFATVVVYSTWSGLAGAFIYYMSAMTRIPTSLIEYDKLLGVSFARELWSVVVPLIYPTMTTFLITGLTGIFIAQGPVYAMFGEKAPYSMYTMGYWLFVQVVGVNGTEANYPLASAAGVMFSLLTFPVVFGAKRLFEKFDPSVEF